MFYLPLSLSFLFSYSSTILSFSFLKFFIPSFAILLCSFPFHHLVYSIYFSTHKKIDLISTLHRPYTQLFFFCNTASWKVKKKTTTFLLFFHHYHISIVFPPPPPHFYCFSPTPPPPPQFYCFSPPPPPPPPPPHFHCFHSSCCFVIWVWSFWPEVGLFGLWLASDPLKDKKAALLLPKKTANSSGTPLLIVSLH